MDSVLYNRWMPPKRYGPVDGSEITFSIRTTVTSKAKIPTFRREIDTEFESAISALETVMKRCNRPPIWCSIFTLQHRD